MLIPICDFFLITGVSKFSKVSLFSDLNHLQDITLLERFETIAGYTQAELESTFAPDIQRVAKKFGKSIADTKEEIKRWYNGYGWGTDTRLYNPFSILNFFSAEHFSNFWWDTGTPTFLIKKLRERFQYNLEEILIGSDVVESYTLEHLDWKSLLFQTGYLTIKKYEAEDRIYTLGISQSRSQRRHA